MQDFFAGESDATEHVGLLGLFEDEDEVVDGLDLDVNRGEDGDKRVGDVINQRIIDPVCFFWIEMSFFLRFE